MNTALSNKSRVVFALLILATAFMAATIANGQTTSTVPLCEINRTLQIGSQGEDVRCLQRYLNWAGYTIAASGSGSPGNETTYYGMLTSAAVAKWQDTNALTVLTPIGLTHGTGFFGSMSFARYVVIVKGLLGVS